MFYLIINEQIRKYIDMIKDKHFGCKKYCPLQIIALDEMELLRKELKKIDIILSDEEYKNLLKSSEPKYFNSVHICITPEEEKKREEAREMQKYLELSKEDRIPKKETNAFIDLEQFEKNYKERKKQEERDEKLFNKSNKKNLDRTGSSIASITSGFSMIVSFFLLVIGSYYLGKYFFGLSDSNTLKLVLVITIIVFLSETCLLLLSLHKEDMKKIKEGNQHNGFGGYYQNSFAYKFNKDYRNKVNGQFYQRFKKKTE